MSNKTSNNNNADATAKKDLKSRVLESKKDSKLWFAVWTILTIVFSIWAGNLWLLLFIILFFDIYITKYIPWSFWKKTKNKSVKNE